MINPEPVLLRSLLGNYPVTMALKTGKVRSSSVSFEFVEVKKPSAAFKRVVRDLEFEFAELAIVTYLMAKAYSKPLVLLPAVVMARFQHPYLVYNAERGPLAPGDLGGRRVGIRSYSVTTVTWIRGILANDYGVDLDRIRWITFEEPHIAEFRDPPNVQRAPEDKDLVGMLCAGEIDAAILADLAPIPGLKPLIPYPETAARAWREKNGALQINHMVVVKESLSRSKPEIVQEIYRLLVESKKAAGISDGTLDTEPFGVEANRRNLELIIDYAHQQKLIPRRFEVDELFDATSRALG